MVFCTICGHPLSEGSRFCPQCGAEIKATGVEPVQEPVVEPEQKLVSVKISEPVCEQKPAPLKNYLPRAIVMSILLFPTGIAAIVHAAKAHTAYIQGQYDLALRENELAAKWCKKTVIAGIIFWVAFVLLYTMLIVAMVA